MRIANLDGRAVLVGPGSRVFDIATRSGGRFGPGPRHVLEHWAEFRAWSGAAELSGGEPLDPARLRAPVENPRQVFAVGMNYAGHAAEVGAPIPPVPSVFTKYRSCLTGPFCPVELVDGRCDWEVEVVVVIGAYAHRVPAERGWEHVAALTIGQDISERELQTAGASPQFSLGKSFPTFGPLGPWLVAADSLPQRDSLELGCSLNGEPVQHATTADLIFPVPELVARLSATVPLLPGDLIFTGTPSGVGAGRTPPRFLRPGDVVESWVDGIGRMRNVCSAPVVPDSLEPEELELRG
ncbi:fumarylacetoacetate hydrolase family protein [Amycolatopsis acidicola]|uniref:Fumarylacetoacetate hydrolase family protein n=1 Tax=Amycolatopsis acidicola TaxID=2596893 RepID=A0A5N0UZE3_9PSEU|nr:fumarylacetoacetate hydrolase family protein [Amycolatopsis acidicola]